MRAKRAHVLASIAAAAADAAEPTRSAACGARRTALALHRNEAPAHKTRLRREPADVTGVDTADDRVDEPLGNVAPKPARDKASMDSSSSWVSSPTAGAAAVRAGWGRGGTKISRAARSAGATAAERSAPSSIDGSG